MDEVRDTSHDKQLLTDKMYTALQEVYYNEVKKDK